MFCRAVYKNSTLLKVQIRISVERSCVWELCALRLPTLIRCFPPVDLDVTFITLFSVFEWIHTDVTGDTLEGFITDARAVTTDTI